MEISTTVSLRASKQGDRHCVSGLMRTAVAGTRKWGTSTHTPKQNTQRTKHTQRFCRCVSNCGKVKRSIGSRFSASRITWPQRSSTMKPPHTHQTNTATQWLCSCQARNDVQQISKKFNISWQKKENKEKNFPAQKIIKCPPRLFFLQYVDARLPIALSIAVRERCVLSDARAGFFFFLFTFFFFLKWLQFFFLEAGVLTYIRSSFVVCALVVCPV